MYNQIRLQNLIPEIFAATGKDLSGSDIWLKDIVFEKGRRYLIEAESGTGKTSLCAYITGMRKDFRGEIFFDGIDSATFKSRQWSAIRKECLAWLPQEIGLFENLTLWENLEIKNRLTGYLSTTQILDYVSRLGLEEKLNVKARLLSIGQQQRVGFIRMLCQPADFFLLDEPVSHLDDGNNQIMTDIMEEVLESTGAGVVATSVGNRIRLKNMQEFSL